MKLFNQKLNEIYIKLYESAYLSYVKDKKDKGEKPMSQEDYNNAYTRQDMNDAKDVLKDKETTNSTKEELKSLLKTNTKDAIKRSRELIQKFKNKKINKEKAEKQNKEIESKIDNYTKAELNTDNPSKAKQIVTDILGGGIEKASDALMAVSKKLSGKDPDSKDSALSNLITGTKNMVSFAVFDMVNAFSEEIGWGGDDGVTAEWKKVTSCFDDFLKKQKEKKKQQEADKKEREEKLQAQKDKLKKD